ncbi:MAG: hypothetical protein HY905_25185 [Deltaproteobacteria bacterium]|nr:hypothetical protein [Deltaproteobacteria bacterium]
MPRIAIDQLVHNGQSFVYRDKHWTTPTGYRVSTSDGQRLTVAFYEKHGRVPGSPPPSKRTTARRAPAIQAAR